MVGLRSEAGRSPVQGAMAEDESTESIKRAISMKGTMLCCILRVNNNSSGRGWHMIAAILIFMSFLLHRAGTVPLEATIIAVDNSMYMVNADHRPNRFQCLQECVNLICNVKTQNPENTIGLMTMACMPEECPCVHIAPAMNQAQAPAIKMSLIRIQDGDLIQQLLAKLGDELSYELRFEDSMKIAWSSLKHRMNKNQRPRIVALVASPLVIQDQQDLIRFGKKLRKNNVAIDIISFGDSPRHNTPVLTAFLDAVDRDGNSHLLSMSPEECPPGGLSDVLFTSPILTETNAPQAPTQQSTSPAAQDFSEYGGINPQLDPELAMALKMSAEEEKARREAQARREREALARSAAAASKEEGAVKIEEKAPMTPNAADAAANATAVTDFNVNTDDKMEENSEDEELRRAIELSMMDQDVDMDQQKGA